YAFPFVATYGGPGGRGFRVLPFYGTREIVGEERSSFVLWPFHIRSERLVPGYGWERRRLDLPFFAAIDGAGRRVRSYGPFAYTHAVDERKGTESIGAPWPLVFRQRRLGERDWQVWRVFPFYGRSDVRGISSRFYAWPAYRRKSEDVDDYHYERRRVLEFLWRRQTLVNETSGHHEMVTTMFPWLRSEQDDWRAFGQAPALFDSLLPKNRGLLALWAPLYGLVRWDTRSDGARDWSLLWGLAAREDGRVLGPWHLELPHGGLGARPRAAPAGRAHAPRREPPRRPPGSRRGHPSLLRDRARGGLRARRPPARRPADGARRDRHTAHRRAPLPLRRHDDGGAGGRSGARGEPGHPGADRRPRHDEGAGAGVDGLPARR